MLFKATGFAFGAYVFQHLPALPDNAWLLLLLPVLWCWWRFSQVAWLCAFFGGFLWSQIHGISTQPQPVPENLLQGVILASGTIQDIPHSNRHRMRFFFEADRLQQGKTDLTGKWRFRISWYEHAPRLLAGDRWLLPLRLKPAHGYHNPGGFDYEGWLYARGVRYTGYVKGVGRPLGSQRPSLDRLRQAVLEHVHQSGLSRRAAGVIGALVVGDRSGLSREDKAMFAATGTSHLIAISGLHIGLIAALAYFLFRWGWRRFPGLCSRWPAAVAAAPFAMSAALAYAALAGFSVPTQRALIMLSIVMAGVILRRPVSPFHVLGLALFAVVVWDPLSVVSAGIWLSFGAVGAILYLAPRSGGRFSWLWLQLGIALALAPILVWQHLPVSVVSPLVNLVAIPVFGTLIVPFSLVAALLLMVHPGLGQLLFPVLGGLLDRMLWVLGRVAQWSPMPDWQGTAGAALPVFGILALLGMRRFRKLNVHPVWLLSALSALILSAVLYSQRVMPPAANHFRFTLLDVGQGLSAVVRTANHVLVFDTGPGYPSGFNTGSVVLLPYLEAQGIRHVDKLILSHGDIDHVGGAPDLLRKVPVGEILTGEPARLDNPLAARRCEAGEVWWWDGVRFEVLYPPGGAMLEGNNASCVLRVYAAGQAVLLTGDIERSGEEWLLQNVPDKLLNEVVVAAHHGSASSSSGQFVDATRARFVLFSAGRNNRWKFPRAKVVSRWLTSGARSLNTADEGAIQFEMGNKADLMPLSWVSVSRHYWHK